MTLVFPNTGAFHAQPHHRLGEVLFELDVVNTNTGVVGPKVGSCRDETDIFYRTISSKNTVQFLGMGNE